MYEGMVAPMSVMKRVSTIFRAKANKALDRMEDPRETLDYSYQKQLELLQKVRRGVADVATSRKRLELQMNQLQQQSDKLDGQARNALALGREDLAREALTRKAGAPAADHATWRRSTPTLQGEEEKLTLASQRLQAKVDAFRTRKETIKATYTAAEAQTRIGEAFSGISEEMGDVGMAIQRAEDKTAADAGPGGRDRRAAGLRRAGRPGRAAHATTSRPSWTGSAPARTSSCELERMKAELAGAARRASRGRRQRRVERAPPRPGQPPPADQQQAGEPHDRPHSGRGSAPTSTTRRWPS